MKGSTKEILSVNIASLTPAETVDLCQRMISLTIKNQTALGKKYDNLERKLKAQRTEITELTKRLDALEAGNHDIS